MKPSNTWTGLVILLALAGCKAPTRQFTAWNVSWPKWMAAASQPATRPAPANSEASNPFSTTGNHFTVRILESAGSQESLQTAWSYLDESSPLSRDWRMLQNNGLRCGVGQLSDWPMVKTQLDQAGMKVRNEVEISLGAFSPVALVADPFRTERTIFYYDAEGRVHGKDYGASSLQLALMTAGRMPEGRIRVIFCPKVVRPKSDLDDFARAQGAAQVPSEQELENFSIVVDVGPQEFALLGPSRKEMAGTLVGPQLFQQWNKGQRKSMYVLISPMALEPAKKPGK